MIIRIYSDMEISYSVHSSQNMYCKGEPRMYCKGEPSTSGSICDETMIFSENTTYLSSSMIRLSSYVSKVENWSVHTTWTCANIKCSHTYLYCRVSLFYSFIVLSQTPAANSMSANLPWVASYDRLERSLALFFPLNRRPGFGHSAGNQLREVRQG